MNLHFVIKILLYSTYEFDKVLVYLNEILLIFMSKLSVEQAAGKHETGNQLRDLITEKHQLEKQIQEAEDKVKQIQKSI
jgi:hypothetical protein